MAATLKFSGATGTVTGSHHLFETGGQQILLDCGLYQGEREWRERNWAPFVVKPSTIDAIVLSHAHIDHTGYLPRLLRDGYRGPIYASAATRELCGLLLPDSARLMEEEADYRNRKGKTRHQPALPLYSEEEAEEAAGRITALGFRQAQSLPGPATLTLHRAGHILGSSLVEIEFGGRRLLFTGDLGRRRPSLFEPPARIEHADYLVLEATYGNRLHNEGDPRETIRRALMATVERSGVVVVPAFAIGRTQEVLYLLRALESEGAIPTLPVVVDSPMATDATTIMMHHPEELSQALQKQGPRALRPRDLRFTRSVEESKALNIARGPMVIISSSGMATGGRILHHLRNRLPDTRNTVLLVGYQGAGTRGRQLQDGAPTVRIFKDDVPVRAAVVAVDALSAHADAAETLDWLAGFRRPPKHTFLVHGEDDARQALAQRITAELGWDVRIPRFNERVDLT
ncbi:MAG: MBL fold metallo-hydrolase [Chloroflexi bacterium]|nr:MBL fold metallo-hydrolase [Chloroflexota bacterium]